MSWELVRTQQKNDNGIQKEQVIETVFSWKDTADSAEKKMNEELTFPEHYEMPLYVVREVKAKKETK